MTASSRFRLRHRSTCRVCGSLNLFRYLDLGRQPPSNSFIRPIDIPQEKFFPLEVHVCLDCGLSQLLDVVASEDIFDEYAYLSSTSKALCRHYAELVAQAIATFSPSAGALAVDIGCNDGIMLKGYPPGAMRLLGVEPSSAGKYAREAGFEVIDKFFDADLAARLVGQYGPAALITTTNVFAHVDDIRSFATGAYALLARYGVWIIEFPYLVDMIERCYFDTIYHEHLSYLALTPLEKLFSDIGLRLLKVERTEVGASGPALRLFVVRADSPRKTDSSIPDMLAKERSWGIKDPARYRGFADDVTKFRDRIHALIESLKSAGARLGAFGAPAKGNTMLNYLGLTEKDVLCAAENNPLKVGKVMPGSHIPIVDDAAFLDLKISHALLLTWNYADFFLQNAEFIKRGGRFIVPFPEPEIRP